MQRGNVSIEDHVAKFKILLADSGVTEDSPATLDYFQKSIRVPLLKKILDQDNIPETLPEWYKKALKIDNNYHKVQRIIKRDAPKKEEGNVTTFIFLVSFHFLLIHCLHMFFFSLLYICFFFDHLLLFLLMNIYL